METDAPAFGFGWSKRSKLYLRITKLLSSRGTLELKYVSERQIISNFRTELTELLQSSDLQVITIYFIQRVRKYIIALHY